MGNRDIKNALKEAPFENIINKTVVFINIFVVNCMISQHITDIK